SIRRVTSRSPPWSLSASPASRSISSETSAKSRAGRVAVPAKMTSSIPPPRRDLGDPSPITHRIASSRLDLPQPLGPTTPVSPGSILSSAGSTKLLKPLSFSRRKRNDVPPYATSLTCERFLDLGFQCLPGRGLLSEGAVDQEGRRSRNRIGRDRVAVHLNQLIGLGFVSQALVGFGGGDAAL